MRRHYSILFSLVALLGAGWGDDARAQFMPRNLEPDRIRPQTKIALPKIETVPDAVDYFLEPGNRERNPGPTYPMVHLRIPKAPYFDKESSNGPARAYGLHITMFYPNFSGLADEENAECRTRARLATNYWGHCRRQLTVSMTYHHGPSLEFYYKIFHDSLSRGYIKPVAQKSRYPGLELVGSNMVDGSTRSAALKRNFYLSRNLLTNQPEFVIDCSEYVPSPACDVSFPARNSSHIAIDLTFVLALLPQWRQVIEATMDKVDSMIVRTYELPR